MGMMKAALIDFIEEEIEKQGITNRQQQFTEFDRLMDAAMNGDAETEKKIDEWMKIRFPG